MQFLPLLLSSALSVASFVLHALGHVINNHILRFAFSLSLSSGLTAKRVIELVDINYLLRKFLQLFPDIFDYYF